MYLQDKLLQEKNHVQKHAWRFEDGTAVEMEWDMYKPGIGNTVTVTTGAADPSRMLPARHRASLQCRAGLTRAV